MRCVKHNTVSHWTDKLCCTWTGQISRLVLIYIHFLYSTLNHKWNTHETISFVYFAERATGKLINLSNKQAAWHKLCLHSSLHRLFILTNMSAKPTKYQGFGQLWEIWKVMEFPDIILIWFGVWESHRNWVNMKIFQFSQKKKKWHLKIHIQACSILRRGLVDYSCQPKKGMHGCWASWFNFLYQNLNIHTLHTVDKENLIDNQELLKLMIISIILTT